MNAPAYLQQAFDRLPEAVQQARATHWQHFRKQGFPSTREEEWRYTDLAALAQKPFAPAAAVAHPVTALPGAELLLFVNGHFITGDRGKLGTGETAQPPTGIASLNAALAHAGLDWTVPANATPPPLHLVTRFGFEAGTMAHLRHRLRLERGAQALVVIEETGDGESFFATQVLDIQLEPGAQLKLVRLQEVGGATTLLTRTEAQIGRDAQFTYHGFDCGGALVRHDVIAVLEAPGAQVQMSGLLMPSGSTHLDVHTHVAHRAPHGTSREAFRCLAMDSARAVFNGKVVVHEGAVKSDSDQQIASLLLSPKAQVYAKPELEIYNDDVKCAHGATSGQLDEDAIYYLRSRGIPHEAARGLLIASFAREVLNGIPFDAARAWAEQRLLAALQ